MIKTSKTVITHQGKATPVAALKKEGHMAEAKAVEKLYEAKEPEAVVVRDKKSDWDDLMEAAYEGTQGKTPSLPMGFSRLNNHIQIRQALYFLLGGYTGSGKTSLADDAFVLNPIDYLLRNPQSLTKLHINYWSMERKKRFKLAKWLTRRIFLDTGEVIPITQFFGWKGPKDGLTAAQWDLVQQYRDYMEAVLEMITIIEGPQNPMAVKIFIDKYAKENGEIDSTDKFQPIYYPKDPHKITINLRDHIGLWKKEKRDGVMYSDKKAIIDLASSDARHARDFYNHTIVDLSQFNRDIANPIRIKNGDVEPQLEDFKDSGSTQEDADVVLTLFDVMRYASDKNGIEDPTGYDLTKLRDLSNGHKKYRSLKIAKNSYGSDDIRLGLAFQPVVGHFREMPKLSDMTETHYQEIITNEYFKPTW
jgi:hypothetical protein